MILVLTIVRLFINKLGMPNFQPIGAIALLAGAMFATQGKRFSIPLGAMLLSDLALAAISPEFKSYLGNISMIAVYGAFALTVLIGKTVLSKNKSGLSILKASILSGIAFFLITNFAAWLDPIHGMYSKDFVGLIQCYAAGLAFYKNDVMSNFFLNGVVSTFIFTTVALAAIKWVDSVQLKAKQVA